MPHEQIQRLKIQGFKSLRELDLELSAFNVLIGANGVGKSNLLSFFQMLNFAFGTSTGNLQNYIKAEGPANQLLYYGPAVSLTMTATLCFSKEANQKNIDTQCEYAFHLNFGQGTHSEGENLYYSAEWLRSFNSERTFERFLPAPHNESQILRLAEEPTDSPWRHRAVFVRDCLKQMKIYHFHNTSREAYIRLNQDINKPSNYLQSDGGNLWLFLFQMKMHQPTHYRRILATVQLIAPFIHDFILEPSFFNRGSLSMGWMDRTGKEFGAHQLSDGTLRAIALVTALLQPQESMPNILFFDEPELGLHPAAIGLIATLLKAASLKRQVVVATQSPLLIKEYQPEDIIVVERQADQEGRDESRFTRLEKASLGRWLEDYDLGQLYTMNVTGGGAR